MRKLMVLLAAGITCIGLTACTGTEFDPAVIEEFGRSVENVSSSFDEISGYVEEVQGAVKEGIDNTNAVMEWYKTEAWADNPWISTPITEDEVEDLIEVGRNEINAYIGDNAVYDVISDEDIEFFNEYFARSDKNGFLLSTYEKPEACDAMEVFSRYEDALEELTPNEADNKDDKEYAGKILEDDVEEALKGTLGITNHDLKDPLRFSRVSGNRYLYIEETKKPVKLVCDGGFYYNNIFVIMMRQEYKDNPFALTALTKEDNGSVRICMNYWSDDMEDVNWDGSFLYDLYGMMQDSDIRNVISIPGIDGDLSLGSAFELASGMYGDKIEKAAELVSDAKDKSKVYMQEFEGYSVYYNNLDPKSVGEYVVSQIDVTGMDFKTAEGAGVGSTIDELKAIYGEGLQTRFAGGKSQLMYDRGKYNILFMLDKSGKVEEMTLFLNEDATE